MNTIKDIWDYLCLLDTEQEQRQGLKILEDNTIRLLARLHNLPTSAGREWITEALIKKLEKQREN